MVLARQRHEPCVRYSGRHFTAGRNRNTAFVPNVHDEGGRLDLREEMSNVKFGDGLKISHRGFRRGADTLKLIERVDLPCRLPYTLSSFCRQRTTVGIGVSGKLFFHSMTPTSPT